MFGPCGVAASHANNGRNVLRPRAAAAAQRVDQVLLTERLHLRRHLVSLGHGIARCGVRGFCVPFGQNSADNMICAAKIVGYSTYTVRALRVMQLRIAD